MRKILCACILFLMASPIASYGWFDDTHFAIAKAAGYDKWNYVVGADMAKIKAGDIEKYNHFFDNFQNDDVTPEMVLEQAEKYNNPSDTEGHLYGAIMASLRQAKSAFKSGKHDAEYHLAFCAHYISDLSNPFHNMLYDDFNKQRHLINDGIVDDEVIKNINKINNLMISMKLNKDNFEDALAKEIAVVANNARNLGKKLKKENRNMTREEAYIQLAQSASLLKTLLNHLKEKE